MADIFPEALRLTTQEKRGIWPHPLLAALPYQSHGVCKLTLLFRPRTPQGTRYARLLPTQAAVAKIVPSLGLAQAPAKAAGRELELSRAPDCRVDASTDSGSLSLPSSEEKSNTSHGNYQGETLTSHMSLILPGHSDN